MCCEFSVSGRRSIFYQLRLVGWTFQKALLSRDFWVLQLLWKAADPICQQRCSRHLGERWEAHQYPMLGHEERAISIVLYWDSLGLPHVPQFIFKDQTWRSLSCWYSLLAKGTIFHPPLQTCTGAQDNSGFLQLFEQSKGPRTSLGCYSESFSTFPTLVLPLSFSGSWLGLQGDFSCFLIYYLFLQLEPASLCYWNERCTMVHFHY